MDYHMQFFNFMSLLQTRGLSNEICGISFLSLKTWTIICNFCNFFPLSKNVDYHKQFLELLSLRQKCGLLYEISGISSILQKHGIFYAIFEISFTFPKTWSIICNF